jgi:soluble lytic murein transglycosylase-like protein
MTLAGLLSIYAGLFFYGNHAKIATKSKRGTKVSRKSSKEETGLRKYQSIIFKAAKKHNVPPALVAAIMHAESNFNPRAVSPVGARGLMQINGITQRHLGVRNVFDPHQNVHGGAKYLRELLNMNRGNMRLAIASYNAGPGAVRKYRGVPPYRETRRYVVKVMKFYRTYKRLLPASLMMAQNDSPNESRS